MKGYQLIEHNFIVTNLLNKGLPDETVISIMSWLVYLLKNDNYLKDLPINIEIIKVTYEEKYPCIGVHYIDDSLLDLESIILNKIEDYYHNSSFQSFYDYVQSCPSIVSEQINNFLKK